MAVGGRSHDRRRPTGPVYAGIDAPSLAAGVRPGAGRGRASGDSPAAVTPSRWPGIRDTTWAQTMTFGRAAVPPYRYGACVSDRSDSSPRPPDAEAAPPRRPRPTRRWRGLTPRGKVHIPMLRRCGALRAAGRGVTAQCRTPAGRGGLPLRVEGAAAVVAVCVDGTYHLAFMRWPPRVPVARSRPAPNDAGAQLSPVVPLAPGAGPGPARGSSREVTCMMAVRGADAWFGRCSRPVSTRS